MSACVHTMSLVSIHDRHKHMIGRCMHSMLTLPTAAPLATDKGLRIKHAAYTYKLRFQGTFKTVCPSGLRGWTQVPLARAAWVQIPQLSIIGRMGLSGVYA